MHMLSVRILRFIDDSQPGWVERALRDAWGHNHLFREKAPVVSNANLDASTDYPQPGVIACEIIENWRDDAARVLIKIRTDKPWGCQSTDGVTCFDVLPEQLTT